MLTLGFVGGVASGKSAAARLLTDMVRGAVRIDGDKLGHQVLEVPSVIDTLVARWGKGILDDAGNIQRSAVARIVFAPDNQDELTFLEQETHPLIRQRIRLLKTEAELARAPLVVVDAALLLEKDWADLCDLIIFVDAPVAVRLQRALATRGWNEQEFHRREAAQWPVERKRAAANEVLANDQSELELAAACHELWERIEKNL